MKDLSPDLLKVPDIARLLGISKCKAHRMVNTGEIPAVRVGVGSVRVRREDYNAYLENLEPVVKPATVNGFKEWQEKKRRAK